MSLCEFTTSDGMSVLLDTFIPIDQSIGLPLLLTLAAVGREPGLSVNELAERLNTPQQTISRYVATLQARYAMPGRDVGSVPLIDVEISVNDPRRRALTLTAAGKARLEEVLFSIYPNLKAS